MLNLRCLRYWLQHVTCADLNDTLDYAETARHSGSQKSCIVRERALSKAKIHAVWVPALLRIVSHNYTRILEGTSLYRLKTRKYKKSLKFGYTGPCNDTARLDRTWGIF